MTKALQEEMENIQKELEALNGEETKEEEVKEEEAEEEPAKEEPEEKEEPAKEEAAKEEPKEEELDAKGHRRLRMERDAERKRAETLERELAEARAKLQSPAKEEAATDAPATDYELEQIKIENRYKAAERAVMQMEEQFKQSAPDDYDDVTLQYRATVYNGIRLENPDLSHVDLLEQTRRKILEIAASHKAKGYDPIERMYLDGKKMGYGKLKEKEAEPAKEELKPDLDKIAANKKRNAGTAGAKGGGERGQMTAEALAALPAHEYAKIPVSERKRIIAGA